MNEEIEGKDIMVHRKKFTSEKVCCGRGLIRHREPGGCETKALEIPGARDCY